METNKKNSHNRATNVRGVEKLTPQDFKNLPLMNKLGVDPEILMTALRNKKDWNDPDPYNLTSPEVCAGIAIPWSEEYLIHNNLF